MTEQATETPVERVKFDPSQIVQYNPASPEHSLMMLQWYLRLEQDNELETTFSHQMTSLATFLGRFNNVTLYFLADAQGIRAAVWFEKFVASAWMGMYFRPDCRKGNSRLQFEALVYAMNEAFQYVHTITGVTCRADILEAHRKLGYTISKQIDDLYGEGKPGWIVSLNKKDFKYLKENE